MVCAHPGLCHLTISLTLAWAWTTSGGFASCPAPASPWQLQYSCQGWEPPGSGATALTDVVEASRGQALRQMRRVEERGQEGHGHMLLVVHGGFVLCTLPGEQEYLQVFKETPSLNMDSLQGPTV